MIIIGTAGHIDHGKSSIVKRLTGTNPDRLPEEKERGMTIDLGFAFYKTPNEETIAFVDVPGHERFVKNMIAGAGGIDVVMLVIAADDGWMPQSEEHFQVVRLLGIKHGLIVINKTDLVENDWLDLLEEDIKNKVKGTFLDNPKIFKVSSQTGDGFDQLAGYLNGIIENVNVRKDINKPRLYIDRSFVQPGIGGVATGTLKGGILNVGQQVNLWPSLESGKIKTLQSNGVNVETAVPGQRTALSLTGINRSLLVRGGVITDNDNLQYFKRNAVLALSVELLGNAPVSIKDRRRVILILGTTEVEGELRLYDSKELKPNQSGIVFFKPDDQVYCHIGDRFILRLPSPMITLGGGLVLDHLQHFPRQKQLNDYNYLKNSVSDNLKDLIVSEIDKMIMIKREELLKYADYSKSELRKSTEDLLKNNKLNVYNGLLYNSEIIDITVNEYSARIKKYFSKNPHLTGLSLLQLQQLSIFENVLTENLIKYMVSDGKLSKEGSNYNLSGQTSNLKGPVKKAYDDIISILKAEKYTPPLLSKLAEKGKAYKDAIKYIIDTKQVYKCGSDFIFINEGWNDIVTFINDQIKKTGKLAVSDLRDNFNITRKFIIPILEETDRKKITKRDGDIRIAGERLRDETTGNQR